MLGGELDPIYVKKLQETVKGQINWNQRRKLEKQKEDELLNNRYPYSDENFYFIAGYTSGGMPYGITWEEAEKVGLLEDEGESDIFLATPGQVGTVIWACLFYYSFFQLNPCLPTGRLESWAT